jgi:hypothetical protein
MVHSFGWPFFVTARREAVIMAQPEGVSTPKNFNGVRHPSDTQAGVIEHKKSRFECGQRLAIVE